MSYPSKTKYSERIVNNALLFGALETFLSELSRVNELPEFNSIGLVKEDGVWKAALKQDDPSIMEGYVLRLQDLRIHPAGLVEALLECFFTERLADAVGVIVDTPKEEPDRAKIRLLKKVKEGRETRYIITDWGTK